MDRNANNYILQINNSLGWFSMGDIFHTLLALIATVHSSSFKNQNSRGFDILKEKEQRLHFHFSSFLPGRQQAAKQTYFGLLFR